MISKIESIKNIGNYDDYHASGDVTLKKINLIYAENGVGKTTLSRIFQSLSTNDSSIILHHSRIGATEAPQASIKDVDGRLHIFNGNRWNKPIPEIVVFDSHFVANNIYAGFEISADHRKKLYQFVLGDSGVQIAKKIDRVKSAIQNNNNDISIINEKIQVASKISDIKNVIDIPYDADINNKIAIKEKELKTAQDNNIIMNYPILQTINVSFPHVNFVDVYKLFELSIDGIGEEYIQLVRNRENELRTKGGLKNSNWLHEGLTYANSTNQCPYCGSDLNNNKLIKGYNQYFNAKYNEVLNTVNNYQKELIDINLDNVFIQIYTAYDKIKEAILFWYHYLNCENKVPSLDLHKEKICSLFEEFLSLVNTKKENPMLAIPTDIINRLEKEFDLVKDSINIVNKFVSEKNNEIALLKSKIRKEKEVADEIQYLQLVRDRYQSPLNELCILAKILDKQHNKWNSINRQLQNSQKTLSNSIFHQYGDKINYYLGDEVFGTNYRITEVKDGGYKGKSKEASLSYTLTFNGTAIEPSGDDNVSFKNVLSEGDKNTIAFSFFLAKVALDPNYANKILVFDDPLTSLDLNRRNATIHQLCLLYQQCKQVIVLSHNLHFLVELNSQTIIKKNDKKILSIIKSLGKSKINEYEIKKDWIDNYQKSLLSMQAFLNNPTDNSKEQAVNSIRISLETFLKLKYCLYISNPNETFGSIVKTLENSNCTFINPDKSKIINKLNQLVSISWRGHHGAIEERDMYTDLELSFEEARKYVSMTLDLLNNSL